MICRLFEFEEDTSHNSDPKDLVSSKDCEHCKDSVCKMCKDVQIRKGNMKFGWHIVRILEFPEGYKSEYKSAMKLTHPSVSPFWIVKIQTDSMEEKYRLLLTHKATNILCDNLKQLNYQLKKTLDYDGTPICAEDWL